MKKLIQSAQNTGCISFPPPCFRGSYTSLRTLSIPVSPPSILCTHHSPPSSLTSAIYLKHSDALPI